MASNTSDPLAEIRQCLLRLVRQRNKRVIGQPPDRPSDWQPSRVQIGGWALTDTAAWDLIESWLAGGCELAPLTLDKPPGIVAYVLKQVVDGVPLYAKLELASGDRWVYGRSFHVDDFAR